MLSCVRALWANTEQKLDNISKNHQIYYVSQKNILMNAFGILNTSLYSFIRAKDLLL